MTKTRNISDLLDANGDVKSTALDNVPPSNDASALTTGTLPDARIIGSYTGITNLTMSGDLTVDTNTLFVDASANSVGIGTSSPEKSLHINSGVTNEVAYFESTDSKAGIAVADSSGSVKLETGSGAFIFNTGGDSSTPGTNTTETVRITNIGRLGIGTASPSQKLDVVGSIEVSDGIYIGGTGTANLLDDYEEGTFTPILATGTATGAQGSYIKIGNLVNVNIYITSISDTSTVSALRIDNLPFQAQASASSVDSTVGSVMLRYLNTTGTSQSLCSYVSNTTNRMQFYEMRDANTYNNLTHDQFNSNNIGLRASVTYRTT